MTPINYEQLAGNTNTGGTVPADGRHTARLERASLIETDKGSRLLTEWSTETGAWWDSWNRFDTSGMKYTQELLDGLGVDRSKLNDDVFADELARCEGNTYQVRTESKRGSQGDRWFTSTYVDGKDGPVPGDLPTGIDSPAAAPAGSGLFADDDIPF